jgi:hypothetical protein
MTLTIGGVEVLPSNQRPTRFTGLFWGSAGTGKTTLACTAPGKKLLVSFDPDGAASVSGWTDVHVVDLAAAANAITSQFKSKDPLGIGKVLEDGEFDTVIIDSLTNVAHKTLMQGIEVTKGASIERPSPGAYGVRNSLALQLVKNGLAITSKLGKHFICIAHEDAPVTNDEGMVMHITLSLGGKLPEQTALDFSEVWCVQDMGVGRDRRILFRPARSRKPMKTRMFQTSGEPEFNWVFNPDTQEGMRIEDWYTAWVAGGYKKLAPPTVGKKK